ncbi:hypothetical protein HPHPH18_0646 [Helicobacter pylori Hp H-18]|nr:hypothetical protein HPHPH18_0646 [Helicobacter pylori Hp H-18]
MHFFKDWIIESLILLSGIFKAVFRGDFSCRGQLFQNAPYLLKKMGLK